MKRTSYTPKWGLLFVIGVRVYICTPSHWKSVNLLFCILEPMSQYQAVSLGTSPFRHAANIFRFPKHLSTILSGRVAGVRQNITNIDSSHSFGHFILYFYL